MERFRHYPVLWREVLTVIGNSVAKKANFLMADCTIGGGAHSYSVLTTYSNAWVIGMDIDVEAVERSRKNLAEFRERAMVFQGNYTETFDKPRFSEVFGSHKNFDVVLADFGMSSYQLDNEDRGFSYALQGPLDMRFDTTSPATAAQVLAESTEYELYTIFKAFGEEDRAHTVAKTIVEHRKTTPFTHTNDLTSLLSTIYKQSPQRYKGFARCFQALRMYVNAENSNIERLLHQSYSQLEPNGLFLAIGFHSLEHQLIQKAFQSWVRLGNGRSSTLKPSGQELGENPRSHSAILHVYTNNSSLN